MLKTVSSIVNAIGALNYKGTWNASTNTPALASGVGTKGDYYVVSVAGSTTLDGLSNWGVGDWATFNGSVWQRVEGGADGNFVNLSATGNVNLDGGTFVFNESGADKDFRFEGDTATHLLFGDASLDALGMGTSTTQANVTQTIAKYQRQNSNNAQGISYRVTRFQTTGSARILVQFLIPAAASLLAIEGFVVAGRPPITPVGASRVAKFHMAIAREGSGFDVVLDSNLNGSNWDVATTTAGGSGTTGTINPRLQRNGAEPNTDPQLVDLLIDAANTNGTAYAAGYLNVVSAATDSRFTINF
jgi:hypothetical protein